MNSRLKALYLRHLYPLKRDFDILSDVIYWPIMDTILWGVTSQWLVEGTGKLSIIAAILTAMVLWDIIWRTQMEVSRSMMEELWNNNMVNLFGSPLTINEWITGILSLSILKTGITLVAIIPLVWFMYQINVFSLGFWMIAFFISTVLTGWWVGFISAGVVLRFGYKAQTIIWTLPAILLPFSAIYFPLDRLPLYLQPISRLIPTTYTFENMRALLQHGSVDALALGLGLGLNLLYLALALRFFKKSFEHSKVLGLGRFD